MPEYIKLEPLREEVLNDIEHDGDTVNYFLGIVDSQPAADVVSREVFEQVKWERDTALITLEKHGIGLGEKKEGAENG